MIEQAVANNVGNIFGNTIYLANFYRFRVNNPNLNFAQAMQIMSINPRATICKTFDEWNALKRRIVKNSKALVYTDENNPFKKNYVFDLSQTYGVDYPPKVYAVRKNIVSDLNSLNYLPLNYVRNSYFDFIKTIKEYNYENGYDKQIELENEYLARYIAIFLNATFPNSIGILSQVDLEEIDLDRKIELCEEAEQIAKEITPYILEERTLEYEERTDTNVEEQSKSSEPEIIEAISTTEQIWNTRPKSSQTKPTNQISIFDDVGHTNNLPIENTERVQPNAAELIRASEQEFEAIKEVFNEPTSTANDLRDDRRNNLEQNNLSNLTNYKLTDNDFNRVGGAKTRCKDNIAAIKLVKQLDEEERTPTEEEQSILAKYVGWGGIPQVFDDTNESWEKEYKELKEVLTEEEYDLAKSSVLTAHFTSKTIIDGMYKALNQMGFTKGSVLEPALGTGNFIGLLPETFNKSKVYGVEIDNLTGRIAKYLYPESNIEIKGFEDTDFKNNQFDSVITNVPFGAYKVYDRDYDKYNFYIHDYFIAKSIDKIKPNGVCAVITSKGTLDKTSSSFRKYVADRAELVGAIRLPNNAFEENAGTKVTTDILFFKKRGTMIDANDSWIYVGQNEDGIPLNEYYIEHPEMLLGTMQKGMSMYGSEDETYLSPDDRPLSEAIEQAIQHLPSKIFEEQKEEVATSIDNDFLPADYNIRNYCYTMIDDKLFMRIDDQMVAQSVAKTNIDRFKRMIDIRNQVRLLLQRQIDNCSDDELHEEQSKLNSMYDIFVKKYGYLNSKFNRNLFRQDADYALLVSLENYDESTKSGTKTDIFTKRTIRIHKRVKSANNAQEALQICKNELGKVDIKYIEQLTGLDYDTVIANLTNSIYKNPIAENFETEEDKKYVGWETADEYLSGNVKQKLRIARLAAEDNPDYEVNVKALEQSQPEDIPASDICVRLGATWIDKKYYEQFLIEKFDINRYYADEVRVEYSNFDGNWVISAPSYCKYGVLLNSTYGTNRMNGFKIAEHCLNLQTINIYDEVEDLDGKKRRVLNKADTIAAREKQKKLEQEFKNWIFENPARREDLVKTYNETFNNSKLQNFDGDYLTFPEMNPCIELKKHQKDAVERIITGGNTLLHHVVGAGKTFEIAAAAMKLRQYGLAHKPMIVVPNHLVMQWTREFKKLYPNANVLMATKKDLEKTNRLKFVSRVATGDWDAVVIAASSFEKIPLSKERQEKKIKSEIDSIEQAILEARDSDENNNLTIKILEKAKKNKEAVLKKLTDSAAKDSLIKFEDLGVDYLFVDEAHKYKNKFIFTKMNNVAGISKAMSQRATDLDMKCEYINELHKSNKGVVFATGTPISNSMVEMFTMQSYMQRDELAKAGLNYFDAWAAAFGETQTALELAPSGNGYRTRTRFAKFTNLPELLKMYRSFADVKTADMLNLPTPKANKITITAKPTDDILRLNEIIQDRAERINAGGVSPEVDNMLKITSDGKKLALDPRCFDETAVDNPENKVNLCIDNVFDIWEKNTDKKSTQIIFCDMSTPKYNYEDYKADEDFDIYNDIKDKLVKKGIPEKEIRFIHEAKTDLQKQNLFDEVRNGNVRVLIGSTEKCGAGTNIQDRLIALHHLDTPYRPSDLEQREGRIIRQGNSNEEVFVYTYVTERTFDSYSYQILENKQKFISQINNGDLTIREASDIDETTLSYAEIKAITTANPKIKQKMELEQELQRLHTLEAQYRNNKYSLQDQINKTLPQRITMAENNIQNLTADIIMKNGHTTDEFLMTIGSKVYTERKDAGDILVAAVNSNKYNDKVIGKIKGFDIVALPMNILAENRQIQLVGLGKYTVDISTSGVGSITRIENYINSLEEKLEHTKTSSEELKKQLENAKVEVAKPFEYEEQILQMTNELAELDAELDLNKDETPIVVDDEELQKEKEVIVEEDEPDIDDMEDEQEKSNKSDMEM